MKNEVGSPTLSSDSSHSVSIRSDCQWLDENNLMDYSMVLGVQIVKPEEMDEVLAQGAITGQPYVGVYQGVVYAYYMGIIDFLQEWTCTKEIAHWIKWCCAPKPIATVPPQDYADQFYFYFNQKFVGDAAEVTPEMKQRSGVDLIPLAGMIPEGSTVTVAGEQVWPINDAHFSRLRQRYRIDLNDFSAPSIFNFMEMAAGGGKGGDLMAWTKDRRFIVKEVNDGDQVCVFESHMWACQPTKTIYFLLMCQIANRRRC